MLALRCFILNHQEVNSMSYELLTGLTASNEFDSRGIRSGGVSRR